MFTRAKSVWMVITLVASSLLAMTADAAEEPAKQDGAKKEKKTAKRLKGIKISKETTAIEGPRREDGRIDYLAALNQQSSEGVTPANNAAVPLFQALSPDVVDESIREEFFEKLGVAPGEGDHFLSEDDYLKKAATEAGVDVSERFNAQLNAARETPWAPMEQPLLAGWITANNKPLDAIAAGMSRPRFYYPLLADDEDYSMAAAQLPGMRQARSVAVALCARATMRLRQGKVEQAMSDLLAGHRLARRVGSGPTLVDGLVAVAIDGITCGGDAALARSGQLTAEHAQAYAKKLAELPRITDMAAKIDVAERYMFLDSVMTLAAADSDRVDDMLGGLVGDSGSPLSAALRSLLGKSAIDWNITLRDGNRWYDQMVKACRTTPYEKQREAMEDFDEQFEKKVERASDPLVMLRRVFLSGESRSKMMGHQMSNILASLLLPAVQVTVIAELKAEQRLELTRLAVLLAAYRAEHDAFPEELADLVPGYLKDVPPDRFRDEPPVYKREADGYLLYSVGPNRQDDGGAEEHQPDAYGPADIVVKAARDGP
jgi:hypothetical protein